VPRRRAKARRPPAAIPSAERLADLLADFLTPSSAVVCVGNELRGDDGAGMAVARGLGEAVPWKVFHGETAPESFLMKVVAARPESVLVIDALYVGAEAGAVVLVAPEALGGQGPSTHGPGPGAFLQSLALLHTCRRAVLGIQPARTDFGAGLSEPVARAAELVVRALKSFAEAPGQGRL